jgi:hypothetical protein
MSEKNDAALRKVGSLLKVVLAVVAVIVMAYSLLIATRPLLGVFTVAALFGAYLLWRFVYLASRLVRAVERIADSLEARE